MEVKTCSKCGIEKELECFSKDRRSKDGLTYVCKECVKAYRDSPENQEHKKELMKAYNANPENKEHKKELYKAWYDKPEIKERKKELNKAYKAKPENKKSQNKNSKERRQNDIQYKLACSLRTRLYKALKNKYKSGSAVSDCGCTMEALKYYLELRFQPGMTWENWGPDGWHIDHIRPLASFDLTDRNQLLAAVHYSNLQPLWAIDNLKKGDKYDPKTSPRSPQE